MNRGISIVGLGEALFDVFPDGARLGGAPLNVAVHAHALGRKVGGQGVVVSRVGQDALGAEVIAALRERGMTTDYVQTDPDRPTGRVDVDLDLDGQPTYDIVPHVAWDVLQYDPDLDDLAQTCDAVCFGTLAQRDAQSRNAIYRFLDTARRAVRLFDVNLRGPQQHPFYDARVLERSCERATIVKLNEHELPIVADLLNLRSDGLDGRVEALLKAYPLEMVVLTRGALGTTLYTKTKRVVGEPVSYPRVDGADSVGAGDACSAGVLVARVLRRPAEKIVALANHMGAFVASQPGATPALPPDLLALV